MECKFWVGQKVVYLRRMDARPLSEEERRSSSLGHPNLPTAGDVYTIRDIYVDSYWNEPFVRLVEVVNPTITWVNGTFEAGFNHTRFRPATDITIFKEIVAKVKNRDSSATICHQHIPA